MASTPEDTVCSFHLPAFDTVWRASFEAEQWVAYKRPTVIVSKAEHPLDNRTRHVQGDNTHYWVSFHKFKKVPVVPADYLHDHPNKIAAKLAQVWNTGVIVATHKVPAVERIKAEGGGYLRTQQMRGGSVAKIINCFSRATKWESQVVILDPFAGAGGTLIAARLTGNYFVGIDKNKDCVDAMEGIWAQLDEAGEGYQAGAGLREDLIKPEAEDGDDDEEGGQHTRCWRMF